MWNSSGHLKLCLFLLRWLNSVESNLVTLLIEILQICSQEKLVIILYFLSQIFHIHSAPITYGYVTLNEDPHYPKNLVKINTIQYN